MREWKVKKKALPHRTSSVEQVFEYHHSVLLCHDCLLVWFSTNRPISASGLLLHYIKTNACSALSELGELAMAGKFGYSSTFAPGD